MPGEPWLSTHNPKIFSRSQQPNLWRVMMWWQINVLKVIENCENQRRRGIENLPVWRGRIVSVCDDTIKNRLLIFDSPVSQQ